MYLFTGNFPVDISTYILLFFGRKMQDKFYNFFINMLQFLLFTGNVIKIRGSIGVTVNHIA